MKRRTNNDKHRSIAGDLLATGAGAVFGPVSLLVPASAGAMGGHNSTNEEIVRKWYAAWEKKDWGPVDSLLADNFTFTSAAGDDHISKQEHFQNAMLGNADRFHWTF
jgi:hypothetical protein